MELAISKGMREEHIERQTTTTNEGTMKQLYKRIRTLIDKLLHRHCGTPKCCGKCEKE